MKKVLSLFFCLIILASFASCGSNMDKYIPEAQYVSLALEIDTNQYLYNEVFVLGHLPVDETKTIEQKGKTYALVTDDTYTTMDALKETLRSVYTDEGTDLILKEHNCYKEIDGKLYYDLSAESKIKEEEKWTRIPGEKIDVEGKTDETLTLEYKFECGKKDELDEFTFVLVDGVYKLRELQKVD